jgi:hypothetical protein
MTRFRRQDEQLLQRLRADCIPIANAFGLCWTSLRRTRSDAKLYGCCDSEGNIRIRLRSRRTGEFLSYSSLIATVCHELAHLRFMDHGPEFQQLSRAILRWARQQQIYAPAPSARASASGPANARWAASARRQTKRATHKRTRSKQRQLDLFPQLDPDRRG